MIVVLKTGEPVPPVLERRGQFLDLIRTTMGDAYRGGLKEVDAKTDVPTEVGDAVIITGSPSNVPDREAWVLRTEEWLRGAIERDVPMLGICFGHQLVASALGGTVVRNPRGRQIGTVSFERAPDAAKDPIFAELPSTFMVNTSHIDAVTKPPAGVTMLGSSPKDHIAAFKVKSTYCVQFHPEFDRDVVRGYLEARRQRIEEEKLDWPALYSHAADAPHGAEVLKRFVKWALTR